MFNPIIYRAIYEATCDIKQEEYRKTIRDYERARNESLKKGELEKFYKFMYSDPKDSR